ncbi:MAG: UDP-N-acetyl-2-amino-2-deoxyglucuronate dehydrogenase [Sphingomonadales bacterium]|jgi:predicted dehydrogenase|nr:UDP-N-acetyl-2-amino-2-deoxyglucuronate dehydrogenase [Sphingomonadales bacterium]
MSRLRVGLLGCGGIGVRHAGAVAALAGEMELAGCCGRDLARTEAFAAAHGGRACTDLDALLDVGIDLLIVALPPSIRSGEIERAAACGVHLLVEKPIALDQEIADRLVAAVESAGVVAAVGFMYRFGDAVARWQASDAGRVGLFAGAYHCNALHAPWWRERARSGGQMLEQAIHLIDLVRLFMGEPDRVYARAANLFHRNTPGYDIEDVSAMIFGWDDGRLATLNASNIAVPGRWQKEWSLYAERMTGRFADWNNAIFTRITGEVAEEALAGTTDPFVAQLADVAAAIRDGRPPRVPLREGAATLRLALAARRSADEGRELRLADGD